MKRNKRNKNKKLLLIKTKMFPSITRPFNTDDRSGGLHSAGAEPEAHDVCIAPERDERVAREGCRNDPTE
jgi:hypothetical protein